MKNKNTNRRGNASRLRFLLILATTAVLVFTGARIQAAPGDLDGSFGNGGVVTTNVNPATLRDMVLEVLIQPDGKTLGVGSCDSGSGYIFCLARYDSDGSLDPTFGVSGKVITGIGGYGFDAASAAAIQADGKIVAGGTCWAPSDGVSFDFCMARYNANGSLDTTFGGDGTVTTNIDSSSIGERLSTVVVQGDNILAAGMCHLHGIDRFCMARYHSDGSLDTSFGGDGVIIPAIGPHVNDVAIQGDGKIVAAGYCKVQYPELFGRFDFCLARYNPDGSLDTLFSEDGIVSTDTDPINTLEGVHDVALQSDGKIVAAGAGAVVRYNPDGSLDSTFNGDGMVIPANANNAMVIQRNGKIITVGGGNNTFTLSRYNTDGSPDTTLDGYNGTISTPLGGFIRFSNEAGAYAVAIQKDGKIVAGGTVGIPDDANPAEAKRLDFALVRYLGDPTNRSPVCGNVAADISVLATPNHTLQLITLSGATDPDGDTLTLTITGVTQDEPVNGQGDGDTSPDAASGPMSNQVYIRGERSGKGDGRVYRIAFTVSDDKGGTCSGTGIGDGTVNVSVPRNQSGVAAVDSGEAFNSFGP